MKKYMITEKNIIIDEQYDHFKEIIISALFGIKHTNIR